MSVGDLGHDVVFILFCFFINFGLREELAGLARVLKEIGKNLLRIQHTSPAVGIVAVAVEEDEGCGIRGRGVWGGYADWCWLGLGHGYIVDMWFALVVRRFFERGDIMVI